MLRKVRREGLSSEQLAALGGSSRLDDSAAARLRVAGPPGRRRQGQDRRDRAADGRRQLRQHAAPRAPSSTTRRPSRCRSTWPRRAAPANAPTAAAPSGGRVERLRRRRPQPRRHDRQDRAGRRRAAGLARADQARPARRAGDFGQAFAAKVSEVTHDPDLDEAVIAFANADFEQCEQSLVGADRPRRRPRPACRDLAGAVRPLPRDRPAAQVREPGARLRAAVRLVGAAVVLDAEAGRRGGQRGAAERQRASRARSAGSAPSTSMPTASPSCASLTLQMPLPWVFDWGALQTHRRRGLRPPVRAVPQLDPAGPRHALARRGERLFTVLQEAAPTGVRDADPAFWQLRLDALRMTNRPDQFDEAAIDYCVTYEVSPPSWEPARCMVRISGSSQSTTHAAAVGGERRLDQLPRVAADRRRRHGAGGDGRAFGPAGRRHRRRR